MHIGPDEKIESFELDYDGKRDRWNGFDPATYVLVIERNEARDEARRKYLKEQQLKKLEEKNSKQNGEGGVSDEDDDEDALKVDEAKVDESKQMDFAKVEKRVRTTGGGSTGTVRNLRIREDTAKYLLNLDVNFAYYDPKTRSMREDPLPDADPNEKFYGGDNQNRLSGQALEFKQLNVHTWEAFEKGQDIHLFICYVTYMRAPAEEKNLATWGTDVPDNLNLDQKQLAEALRKEDERKKEEKDERKRKYNVRWNDEVTAEEMEAYRIKKIHHDDPMKDFLH